jgi:anti-sigma factor RsiW
MDCNLIQPDLVPYHFGLIEDDARLRVEEHLLGCQKCLRDYIVLKRQMESSEAKPSAIAKQRLRQAVATEIARPRVVWSWWERPLAVAIASLAIFAAAFAVRTLASSPGTAPHAFVTQASQPY